MWRLFRISSDKLMSRIGLRWRILLIMRTSRKLLLGLRKITQEIIKFISRIIALVTRIL